MPNSIQTTEIKTTEKQTPEKKTEQKQTEEKQIAEKKNRHGCRLLRNEISQIETGRSPGQ